MDLRVRKAKKNHECTLCKQTIEAGSLYMDERIAPWEHVDNDYFFQFKAHPDCHSEWLQVGHESDWKFPEDENEWNQQTGRCYEKTSN